MSAAGIVMFYIITKGVGHGSKVATDLETPLAGISTPLPAREGPGVGGHLRDAG